MNDMHHTFRALFAPLFSVLFPVLCACTLLLALPVLGTLSEHTLRTVASSTLTAGNSPFAAQANPFTGGARKPSSVPSQLAKEEPLIIPGLHEMDRPADGTDALPFSPNADDNPAHGQQDALPAPIAPGGASGSMQKALPDDSATSADPFSYTAEPHSGQTGGGIIARQYTRLLREVTRLQKELRRTMSTLGNDIAHNPGGQSFWTFVGLSFLYGMIHALGPGHGKSVVFAYFLGKRGTLWRGALMGHALTLIHVLSAVVLVLGLRWLAGATGMSEFDAAGCGMQTLSYGMVIAIGIFMACHALYELFSGTTTRKVCCGEAPLADYRGLLSVSFLAGLVPCPGAALILSFALSLNIPLAGAVSMLALILGMGITTSLFGILSMVSRQTLLYAAGKGPRVLTTLYTALSLTGALCIIAAGWLMLDAVRC